MTFNENYHVLKNIIKDLERAYNADITLSIKNKSKPLNTAVAYALNKLKQTTGGQLSNDNSR